MFFCIHAGSVIFARVPESCEGHAFFEPVTTGGICCELPNSSLPLPNAGTVTNQIITTIVQRESAFPYRAPSKRHDQVTWMIVDHHALASISHAPSAPKDMVAQGFRSPRVGFRLSLNIAPSINQS
jgi:hypothetical protein